MSLGPIQFTWLAFTGLAGRPILVNYTNYLKFGGFVMDDYEKYEAKCKQIKAENEKHLEEFESWLKASGLSENTIHTHFDNIDFYINHFLLYEDVTRPEDGAYDVGMFLGYWFIRKAMWSTPSAVKSSAASLKKFYTFLLEKKLIESAVLDDLKENIKEGIHDWMERAKLN